MKKSIKLIKIFYRFFLCKNYFSKNIYLLVNCILNGNLKKKIDKRPELNNFKI